MPWEGNPVKLDERYRDHAMCSTCRNRAAITIDSPLSTLKEAENETKMLSRYQVEVSSISNLGPIPHAPNLTQRPLKSLVVISLELTLK